MKSNQHKVNKHNRPVHEYEIPTPLILIIKKKKKKTQIGLDERNKLYMNVYLKQTKQKKKKTIYECKTVC